MTINQNTVNTALLNSQIQIKSADTTNTFANLLQGAIVESSKSNTTTASSTKNSDALESFKESLKSKGALQFYQDYNQEKIDKMIEEKKAELMDKLGLSSDSQPALTGTDRETALANLNDMLDAFKKQLQEKMRAEDQLQQQANSLSTFLQKLS